MPDREKVIEGLECCKWSDAGRYDGYEPMYENCEKCPYNNEQDSKSECNDKLRQDALSLLKEQEPVDPIEMIDDFYPIGDPLRTIGWRCGKCGDRIAGYDNFCQNCGKAVKWDD